MLRKNYRLRKWNQKVTGNRGNHTFSIYTYIWVWVSEIYTHRKMPYMRKAMVTRLPLKKNTDKR